MSIDSATLEDKTNISMLIQAWGIWRDSGAWAKLRSVYTPDAVMAVSWFDGTASDFVDGCERMFLNPANPISSQHLIGASVIEVNGIRAVAETRTSILIRLPVHDIEADVTAIGRFYDLLRKDEGVWRIRKRVAIFDKDSMQAVDPTKMLAVDSKQLYSYPPAYRCCAYVLEARGGMTINVGLPAPGSASLAALYEEGRAWLSEI